MTACFRLLSRRATALCLAAPLAVPLAVCAQAPSSTPQDALAGAILYRDKGCAHCHGVDGEGSRKAPALAGIRTDKAWSPEKITQQILNGGQKMPPFGDSLTDPEIAQLVVYLRAAHKPAPPPAPHNQAPAQPAAPAAAGPGAD